MPVVEYLPLVAQWIEQFRPKEEMGVRFPSRGWDSIKKFGPIVKWYHASMAWMKSGLDSP